MAKLNGKELDRRSIVKGAAWSAPVLAAAIATPLAAASTAAPLLSLNAGCVQILGAQLLPGFSVQNTGTADWDGTITLVETIDISRINLSLSRSAVWTAIGVEGVLPTRDPGVVASNWVGHDGTGWVGTGLIFSAYKRATRTITINTKLTPGKTAGWGQLITLTSVLNLLGSVQHTASITSPTGNPPVVNAGPRRLDWNLIGGC